MHRAVRRAGALTLVVVAAMALTAGSASAVPEFPSCYVHDSPGPDGTVHVQTTNRNIAWAVRMYPSSKSIGVWALKTYLNGKPTPSGFNRPVTGGPYQPHGTVPAQLVRPGQVFTVRGAVFATDGNEYLVVGTPCRTQ